MLVYVTSLYSVREDYLPTLYQNFQHLLPHIPVAPIYVFTDREIPFELPPNCHVIQKYLYEFATYERCCRAFAAGEVRLPRSRNPHKDTAEFMALMNTKVEMMWLAAPLFPRGTTHVAWIDAGIHKIVAGTSHEKITKAFTTHMEVAWPVRSVAIPGCWSQGIPPSSDSICWRFCGGFFVVPAELLDSFYRAIDAVLEKWLRAGHLAWEVNVWAALEYEEPAWFTWWGADHNLTMLEVPGFLGLVVI